MRKSVAKHDYTEIRTTYFDIMSTSLSLKVKLFMDGFCCSPKDYARHAKNLKFQYN